MERKKQKHMQNEGGYSEEPMASNYPGIGNNKENNNGYRGQQQMF